ncbi:jmjC domain-containing protein 8 isoform X1 [Syngnathus acus]|uniref:jmjC domain-containing protein 8 isoform X1 n=1 Tax=Syngnathus acus TaxID=161584 RepID=UPI001885B2B3|nr:jmjC domain-containing protein 8 isoform X1 [Syngnathus acus]
MELWKILHPTAFRLALLSFFVLLEAQTLSEHQQEGGGDNDGGWWCGSHLSVEDEGLCNLEVVDGSSLSLRHFLDSYAYRMPVVITGLTDNAKFRSLCSKWNLLAAYGERQVRLSTANTYSYTKVDVSFRDYVNVLLRPQSPGVLGSADTLYMFGDNNLSEWQSLLDVYKPPPFLLPHTSRAFSFGVAGPGTGVPFHWHGPGYSEVIYGRKRWFLYPPEHEPHFHPNISTLSWLRNIYPHLTPRQAPLECTIRPGQVLYFPDRWWHATLNLDTSVFISTFLG